MKNKVQNWYIHFRIAVRKRWYRNHKYGQLLALKGSGKHIWKDEHADEYVARLRDGWD